jgi:hypothetical protein
MWPVNKKQYCIFLTSGSGNKGNGLSFNNELVNQVMEIGKSEDWKIRKLENWQIGKLKKIRFRYKDRVRPHLYI